MIRSVDILMIGLVIILSIALYNVKYRAQEHEAHARALHQEIRNEEDAIRVLRAEWSYLTQPDRIQRLAERHLDLEPLQASQIATFDDLPPPPREDNLFGPYGRQPLGGYAGIASESRVQ